MKEKFIELLRLLFGLLFLYSNNKISLFLFNLRSYYHTNKKILKYDNLFSAYYLIHNNNRFYIAEKSRCSFYYKGLEERIKILKSDYHLDYVPINNNDLIIDCGSNIGEFRHCFKNKIEYIGFEPSLKEFKCLSKNIFEGDKIYNIGLWDENKKLELYIDSAKADSSFVEIKNYQSKELVKVSRMDSIIDRNKKIKLLKLEAEGCELEVIKGCQNILHNIDYITADLGYERGLELQSTFENVSEYLLNNNFVIIKKESKRIIYLFKRNY